MHIKALVVDNDPVLLKAVSTLLEQEGCQVKTASDGLEALDILHEYRPDIVFTDLVMPLVGGEKLCRIIRKSPQLKHIFLVILSAIILEDRERSLAALDYDLSIAKGSLQEMRVHLREALSMFTQRIRDSKRILGDIERTENEPSASVLGELLSEKYHLKEILENLNEGIIELNHLGKIVSLNQAALKILGRDMEDLIGVSFAALPWGGHQQQVLDWLQHDLQEKRLQALDISDLDPILVDDMVLSASFLPVLENESLFAICILRDITRQHRAERQKREFENAVRLVTKMDAMSCMAGGVAHDFNNLLTVICGNLDMINLTSSGGRYVENQMLIDSTRNAAYLTVDLVRKISCFSPFGIINREDVAIEDLVVATAAEFFRETPGRYSCHIGPEKNTVSIDSEQIAAAITNILQNAMEAGATGALDITIRKEVLAAPSIRAGQYVPEGKFVCVGIRDNGRGIEHESLLKIFDPYYSTKQRGVIKGMGLGLTIVYSTLRNHGGYVVVESEPGVGTEISLFLPVYTAVADVDTGGHRGGPLRQRILFMERDEQQKTIGKIMLEYLGHEPVPVADKENALEEVLGGLGGDRPVSMALVNLSGTGGSDGLDICRALRAADPNLKVVVTSAALLDPVMQNYKDYGFVNILPKPYTMDDLKRVISIS